jgi:hypothetical protein
MNPFQSAYDWFKKIYTPSWLKEIFAEAEALIWQEMKAVTKQMIDLLIAKIEDLQKTNMTGTDKFNALMIYAKQVGVSMPEIALNAFLNNLVLTVKGKF